MLNFELPGSCAEGTLQPPEVPSPIQNSKFYNFTIVFPVAVVSMQRMLGIKYLTSTEALKGKRQLSRVKKIALIEPKPPGYHVDSRIALPRLGLPLLGAMLRQRGIEVSIYCPSFHDVDYDDVLKSDLVGISTTTSTAPEGYRIAGQMKQAGIPVVMGGSHVSFMADEALGHADFCARGEGEYTMLELVDAIESGSGFNGIKGLSYKVGEEVRHNPARELVTDLDALPFPDLSLIKGSEKIRITPVATSRGCPYDCSFCSVVQMFGRGCRERSIESVTEELQALRPNTVFFYDDNFTANRERTKRLLELMLPIGMPQAWTAQARVDVVRDRELLKLMKRTNCYMLYVGFESVNPATLKEYNKRQSVEEIEEAVRVLHEHGIMAHGMFVFGAENDDVQSLRSTLRFALKNHIDTVQFMTSLLCRGHRISTRWSGRAVCSPTSGTFTTGRACSVQPSKMSPYELQKETFRAMKRFYSVRECVRMLWGQEFLKFLTKLNANILLGRWRSAKRQIDARMIRWFYRAYGHVLIRRWEAANKDFGERLTALAQKARALRIAKQQSTKQLD